MQMKKCSKCHIEKDIDCFRKKHSQCKSCCNLYNKKYGQKHKLEKRAYNKQYKLENKDKIKVARSQYYLENKERENNSNKQYYNDNKISINSKRVQYIINRRKLDINFKIRHDISASVRSHFHRNCLVKGKKSVLQFLSYSIQDLKDHLESQFERWMTWDNRGIYKVDKWQDDDPSTWTWQIDHIIPQSTFNYTSMEDQAFKDCWALSNLRPYSAKQNLLDKNRKNNV
jgi:hypothetical protein